MFSFATLVDELRTAVRSSSREDAITNVLRDAIRHPDEIFAATPTDTEDEVLLHEDERISVWRCRYHPGIIMPPHEHCMPVIIGTYGGVEKSIIFERSPDGFQRTGEVNIGVGEVVELPADVIHSVTGAGAGPSDAIHVYLGPLTQVKRDLFEWESGDTVEFTMEKFDAMKRRELKVHSH